MRSFRRKPPWVFNNRTRADQLVCDPRSYVRAWQEDGRALWAPCLAWAPGPATLASTGDGTYPTLFGSNWLLQICDDGSWVLYQRTGNEILTVIPWDVVPPVASLSARHPTLAFDQAARPAMAWEDDAGIHLRQFDEDASTYTLITTFAGHDPVLWNDATVNGHVPGSDVILFYLSSDRLTLEYRLQSENFATEHDHHTFTAAAILDAHELLMLRYQLKVGVEDGGGKDLDAGDPQALRSLLYPAYLRDEMNATIGNFPASEYPLVVTVRTFDREDISGTVGNFASAEYHNIVIIRTFDAEGIDATVGNFDSGAYALVVLSRTFDREGVDGAVGNFTAADNTLVVIKQTFDTEGVNATVGNFTAAEYAAI